MAGLGHCGLGSWGVVVWAVVWVFVFVLALRLALAIRSVYLLLVLKFEMSLDKSSVI